MSSEDFKFEFNAPFSGDLQVVRIDGHEAMGQLFEFKVRFIDDSDPDAALLSADDVVGTESHLKWELDFSAAGYTGGVAHLRDFHGFCTDFRVLGKLSTFNYYEITFRPRLWLTSQKTNSRIFIDKTLEEIITTVLDDSAVSPRRFEFAHKSETIHYTVQYQETDLAFISRLLEKHGATYIFDHSSSGHEIVFRDASGSIESAGEVKYHHAAGGTTPDRYFNKISRASRLRTDVVAIRDYDYESAGAPLESDHSTNRSHASKNNEVYVYPAGWTRETNSQASDLARFLVEAETAESALITISGYAPDFLPGMAFTISENPAGVTEECVLLRAYHTIDVMSAFRTSESGEGDDEGSNDGYTGRYEAVPSALPYPPKKVTPWPRILGPQTAKVVGEGEIDIDDQGRILVAFHWDRADDPKSCRIRVAQLWAGNEWGGVFVPRVDMEVIVQFLGGDPDRPLVTGCVYNSDNVNPAVPEKKTRSGIRTESSEGGGGHNMLQFEDKAGEEWIKIRATKDMFRYIKNDDLLVVEEGNRTVEVDQGNDSTQVKMGNLTIAVDAGKIEIEAAQSIELKVGGSSIKIDPMKIELKAPQIKNDGSMMFEAKGGISAKLEGGAMATIKGGMVMIN